MGGTSVRREGDSDGRDQCEAGGRQRWAGRVKR
jgi:hypothetical protein